MKSVGTRFFLLRTGLALGLTLAIPAFFGVACECPGGEPVPPVCEDGEVLDEPSNTCVPEGEGEGEGDPPLPDAALTINPTVRNFGSVADGETSPAEDFTVTNSGDAGSQSGIISAAVTGEFTVVDNGCTASLGAGETCTVSVAFAPNGEGNRSGNLTVTAGDLSVSAALSGDGQGPADLAINPSTANFGNVVVNDSSAPQTFTVTNNGDGDSGDLTVGLGGADASHFAIDTDGCTSLAPGASCDIVVSFSPTNEGGKAATLNVDSATADPVSASLTGTAQEDARLTISPSSRNFGTVTQGRDSTELDFTITNVGDVASGALGEAIAGADFTISASGCDGTVLAPNASCTVSVTFSPATLGDRTGTLTVDAAPGGTVNAALSGTAVAVGNLSIAPTANDFGSQTLDTTSASATFTVTNDGGSATGLLSSVLSGGDAADFQFVAGGNGCQGVSLPAAGTCTVAVTFRPGTAGARSANVTVTDASTADIAVAALTGIGLGDAQFSVNPTGIDFGSIAQNGQSANANIVVSNIGQVATGTPVVTLGGANFSQFTIVANGCTAALAPAGNCTVTLRYNPTAQAAHSATLTVSGTPGNSAVTQLAGTGISPSALAFSNNGGTADMGTVVIGGSGTPRVITIRNDGQETSGVIGTTIVGAGAANFTLTENCNTLTAGATCTATVTFVPVAPGGPLPDGVAKVAQLSVTANPGALTAITTGDLTGEALDKLSANPAAFNFNSVRIGSNAATEVVLTQNTGTGAAASGVLTVTSNSAEFTVITTTTANGDCAGANLNPAADNVCNVRVQFAPVGAPGLRTASVTVTNAATGSTAVIALSGTAQGALSIGADQALRDGIINFTDPDAAGPAAIEVDDATLDFGNQPINTTSGLQRFLVINTSTAVTQRLTTDLTGGANFVIQSDTCAGAILQPRTPAGVAFPTGAADDCDFDGAGPTDGPAGTDCLDTCQIQGWFLPRTVGAKTGTITIGGNAGQVIVGTFTGTGITAADVDAAPTTVDFGTIRANANSAVVAITITNSGEEASGVLGAPALSNNAGENPGEFDIITAGSTCLDVTPGGALTPPQLCNGGAAAGCPAGSVASCILNVQFTPGANSNAADPTKNTVLTIGASPGGNTTVALTGVAASQLTINPTAQNFGNDVIDGAATGTGAATRFTVTNNGAVATSALTAATTLTTDFAIVPSGQLNDCNGLSLAAGGNCVVDVRFAATAAGARTSTLTVSGAAADVSVTAALTGTGQTQASITATINPSTADFGGVLIGTVSANQTFTVRNTGDVTTTPLTATLSGLDAAAFQIVTNGCNAALGAGLTCSVVVRAAPTVADADLDAALDVTATDPDGVGPLLAAGGTTSAVLDGVALNTNSVTITPSFHNFGNAVDGTNSANQTFTVTNTAAATTGTLTPTISAEFTIILTGAVGAGTCNTAGFTLANGATCTIVARFSPTGVVGRTLGTLSVGAGSEAALEGNAQEPANVVRAPGGTINLGSAGVGTSTAPVTVTVSNTGDVATGAVTAPVLSGGAAAQFSVVNNNCTTGLILQADNNAVGGADECTFQLVFSPTATGARTITATVAVANATGSPLAIAVSGTGDNPAVLAIDPAIAFTFANTAVTATSAPKVYTVSNDIGATATGALVFSNSNTTDFQIVPGAAGAPADCESGAAGTGDADGDGIANNVDPDDDNDTVADTILGANGQCEIVVVFKPVGPPSPPNETNTLTVAASPGGTVNVTQTGTALSQLDLTINGVGFIQTPTDTLADVSDRTTEDASFTVRNLGSVDSGAISVFLTKATEFSILANDCSAQFQRLAAAGTTRTEVVGGVNVTIDDVCTITVRYSPADATLNDSATLTVTAVPGDSDSVTFNAVSQN